VAPQAYKSTDRDQTTSSKLPQEIISQLTTPFIGMMIPATREDPLTREPNRQGEQGLLIETKQQVPDFLENRISADNTVD